MNTEAFGTAYIYTLLYFSYNWFVIYSQNKMVYESLSITGMGHDIMTSDINYIDFFQFLNWSCKKLFSLLIKIRCFHRKLASLF